MLLQEVVRASEKVPLEYPRSVHPPRRTHPDRSRDRDIEALAERHRMFLAYVPSMRNGNGPDSNEREDRGCAILSNLPLSDIVAVELPWVRQRRVAVMATIDATQSGLPWPLRLMSVHLENRPGPGAQAAALAQYIQTLVRPGGIPLVVGGDLNTWSGVRDRAVRPIQAVIPRVAECGRRPTFRFGRLLDHFFTTLPSAMRGDCHVLESTYESDHHPIVLNIPVPPNGR
jgi:endonuclease/exonuclease/phosphatase family metal-dependent hydrolase